jgi:DNA-binding beta-propeller fold protein YncE
MNSRTVRATICAVLLLGLAALPLASRAAAPEYHVVAGWPEAGAPDYGTAAVSAVAVRPNGEVFVFQRTPHPVLVFSREGRYLRSWGAGMFTNPHGCRFDPEGNLWLTDNADHRVLKLTSEGKVLATFGVKNVPGEDATHFNKPADVAFAPNGDVYVADGYGNSRVVRLSHNGAYLGAWGKKGTGAGEFNLPHSVAVDTQGRVYVADRENARVQVFTPDGGFITQWKQAGRPYGLFLTPDQRLFVSDGIANTLSIFSLEGRLLARWGEPGSAPGQMSLPHLICVDNQGAVYVAEINGKRVQKFVAR